MSWISGIADKAEQFLVQIDENAAGKLQKKKSSKSTQEVILSEVKSDNALIGYGLGLNNLIKVLRSILGVS